MRHFIFLLFLVACHARPTSDMLESEPLDVVIIPGCPARAGGALSGCQWQRAIWGAMLWEDGATRHFITSGGAVQNRYIESEGIKAGMVALGVPADVIFLETQALHTDENTGFSMAIADELGFERRAAASHGGQARGMRSMMNGWGDDEAAALPMELGRVISRIQDGLPDVATDPVPATEWLPMKQREKEIARRLDKARRLPSWWVYTVGVASGSMKRKGPPAPPVTEPSLRGERHRVDTQPWPTDHQLSAL